MVITENQGVKFWFFQTQPPHINPLFIKPIGGLIGSNWLKLKLGNGLFKHQ